MLFNSYIFIFAFLPAAIVGFFAAARWGGERWAIGWLIAASVFFYGWWDVTYVPLLAAVMLFTFFVGRRLAVRPSRPLLAFGIAVVLGVLAYFKYAGFILVNFDLLTGGDATLGQIVLPLAISFFTFQKIAYLVDSNKGLTRGTRFLDFTLFVTFFPQLIAGPIVHWREITPQFRLPATFIPRAENFAVGITIFAIGLFKKAVLADGIATHATPVFGAAAAGASPDLITAWGGALAYTFQLYFDFSGYSDMAIGAARLFGIILPLNFNSPYKAANIIDFWRRWHMTLSRFLRDYLYIALGGNRRGTARRYANLFATMLLGGLWHGAGWQFVLWGALHGAYLTLNNMWRMVVPRRLAATNGYRLAAWGLTFVVVVIAWVPFRAANLETAGRMLAGMAGINGLALPAAIGTRAPWLAELGFVFDLGGGSALVATWGWIAGLFIVARFLPNSQELMAAFRPALDHDGRTGAFAWRPTAAWGVAMAGVALMGVLSLAQVSEFLYFQF